MDKELFCVNDTLLSKTNYLNHTTMQLVHWNRNFIHGRCDILDVSIHKPYDKSNDCPMVSLLSEVKPMFVASIEFSGMESSSTVAVIFWTLYPRDHTTNRIPQGFITIRSKTNVVRINCILWNRNFIHSRCHICIIGIYNTIRHYK